MTKETPSQANASFLLAIAVVALLWVSNSILVHLMWRYYEAFDRLLVERLHGKPLLPSYPDLTIFLCRDPKASCIVAFSIALLLLFIQRRLSREFVLILLLTQVAIAWVLVLPLLDFSSGFWPK